MRSTAKLSYEIKCSGRGAKVQLGDTDQARKKRHSTVRGSSIKGGNSTAKMNQNRSDTELISIEVMPTLL